MVKHAKSAVSLPKELRKQVAGELKDDENELAVWTIADGGWRAHIEPAPLVADYLDSIRKLAAKTGRAVNTHVQRVTGKPLWKAT